MPEPLDELEEWGPSRRALTLLGYADGAAGWEAVKDLAVTR